MTTNIESPVVGTVWKIEVEIGDSVEPGDVVMILESMKMEIPVEVETAGTVTAIEVAEGDAVAEGDVVVMLA
jgi:acetyl-CoA carboxylase biotin carboxyl carrier protein